MFIQSPSELLVTANGIDGSVDAEHDKRCAQIVGEETEHVKETTLFPIAACQQVMNLVDHDHFEVHVVQMA
ncbi:hypothetical protein DSM14862_04049 (plasmid) [Sulfitobacter indolifex]|nr:hypothetical protein DSM14862_04049 [Sulfitobacter indolifex]